MGFIQKHWRGQYPLNFSFWLIFIGLGFVFHLLSAFILQQVSDIDSMHIAVMITYQVSGGLVLLPWQAIGLLRSAELHFKAYGQPVILHLVQAGVIIGIIGLTSHFVGLIQTLSLDQKFSEYKSRVIPHQYSIQWDEAKNQILLRGPLDFGVTNAVRQLLETHPSTRKIILQSEGGQIYEGRGLAILFHQYGLDTYSFSYCLSSCATAFIGGNKRYLGKDAKLGFHQYTFDSKQLQTFQDFYNLKDEQEKDLDIYRSKNINEHFIQQIFKKPNSEIWYPDQEILIESGVVTAIVRRQR